MRTVDLTTARALNNTPLAAYVGIVEPTPLRWLLNYALAFNVGDRDPDHTIDLTAADLDEVVTIVGVCVEYMESNGYARDLDEGERDGSFADDRRAALYMSYLVAWLDDLHRQVTSEQAQADARIVRGPLPEGTVIYTFDAATSIDDSVRATLARKGAEARAALIPADAISPREEWALRLAHGNLTPAERREMFDFLGYPDEMPRGYDLTRDIVLRILGARVKGVHIA